MLSRPELCSELFFRTNRTIYMISRTRFTRLAIYENVLERMLVIQEFFQSVLVVLRVCWLWAPCACFLCPRWAYLTGFFYRIKKYSKLLPHGPSTCRDITRVVISRTRPEINAKPLYFGRISRMSR